MIALLTTVANATRLTRRFIRDREISDTERERRITEFMILSIHIFVTLIHCHFFIWSYHS
jgi:hypothetical protein